MTEKSPSERRYEKNRQSILDAARSIIVEQGVQALSMRALAQKADYSASALYKYFNRKEAIISALRQEGLEISAQIQRAHLQPGMPMEMMMQEMWKSYLEFAREYPAHYMLIMNSSEDVPEDFSAFLANPNFKGLLEFATGAVTSGQIILPSGYEPIHLAFLMGFLAHGAAMTQLTTLRNCPAEFAEISARVLQLITDMLHFESMTK